MTRFWACQRSSCRAKSANLDNTTITDAGLKEIGKIKSLVELDLYQTKITDEGLKHLAPLTNLRELFVEETKVTSQGASDLKKLLPKWAWFSLARNRVTRT